MRENVWVGKLTLPLSGPLFKSYFCLSSLASEYLKVWADFYMHPTELIEYKNITNKRKKHDYLLRNHCMKQVILACLEKPLNYAKQLHMDKVITNQLTLRSSRLYYKQLQISVTYSETVSFAVAFEGLYPLGIDIEKINSQKNQFIENTISFYEKSLVMKNINLNDIKLVTLWTAKESLCKALGGGLSVFSEITEVLAIFSYDNYIEIHFKHFPGYRAYSFIIENYILTIVFPHSKRLQIDINQIWKDFKIDRNNSHRDHSFWNKYQNHKNFASYL